MKLFKSIFRCLIALTVLGLFCVSCAKVPQNESIQEEFKLMIMIQSPLEISVDASVTFKYYSGLGPKEGDEVVLRPVTGGDDILCDITNIDSDTFTFRIPEGIKTGTYSFYIKRGSETRKAGTLDITVLSSIKVPEKDGFNIYGMVSCGDKGVEGVLISDGTEFTKTDKNGVYYLKSSEVNKNVFMVVPSEYEAKKNGVISQFFGAIDGKPETIERKDFSLEYVGDQSKHIMYMLGDMHLANRTSDLSQFNVFIDDIQKQINSEKNIRQYAMTLGDMSWDLYWYKNNYDLYSYVETINKLSGISLFHTIGNHDHDMAYGGDYDTVDAYRKCIGPNYYSFNIGDLHYIVLDNILCTNTPSEDGSGRDYNNDVSSDQIEWLRKDLSYVDKSKTLVITGHAQFYSENGEYANQKTAIIEALTAGYKEVHLMSAHTHVIYNIDNLSSKGVYEHNSGAVCGTWWWTGHLTKGLYLSKDGTPSGYTIYNMNGTDLTWRFKGIGKDINYQFRTYDRNAMNLSASSVASSATASLAKSFESSAGHWVGAKSDNSVYFNIFNYDPAWTIEVKENGKVLTWEKVKTKDPLHLCAYEAQRANQKANPTSSFKAFNCTSHIFKVVASSATSTLEFKITDRFGNVYTETMTRPKNFRLSTSYN